MEFLIGLIAIIVFAFILLAWVAMRYRRCPSTRSLSFTEK